MKTHIRYGGLLCTILLLFASCGSLSSKAVDCSTSTTPPPSTAKSSAKSIPCPRQANGIFLPGDLTS